MTRSSALTRVQTALKRSSLRRSLRAACDGGVALVQIDLADRELNALAVLEEIARPLRLSSPELHRLNGALAASGSTASILNALDESDPILRERAVRAAGALRLDAAVPWLAGLLAAREARVRLAACRSLGRIGGTAPAEALIAALRVRRLPSMRLVIELARAAPDLYLESCLNLRKNASVRPSLVAALSLRRRRTALPTMRRLVASGSQRERTYACRALVWLGDAGSADYVATALDNRSWRVRQAAARALGQLGDRGHAAALEEHLLDPNREARAAAAQALRKLGVGDAA